MIEIEAPRLPAAEVAGRLSGRRLPFWLCMPGDGEGAADVRIRREVVGCEPARVVGVDGGSGGAPLEALEAAWKVEQQRWCGRGAEAIPPALPVGVGWFSYDLGRRFERLPSRAVDDLAVPDLQFGFYDAVWIGEDARDGNAAVGRARIAAVDAAAAARLLDRIESASGGPGGGEGTTKHPAPAVGPLSADQPATQFLDGVARIGSYLRAGDVYQVNLSRRLSASCPDERGGDALLAMAATLRRVAPAPHGIWIGAGPSGHALLGNSPERFLRVTAGCGPAGVATRRTVETAPIKGTRPRHVAPAADRAAVDDLRSSPKDQAEHLMIVDLERNDLGRVCLPGSVAVKSFSEVMTLPTVHHLVSTVVGQLRPEIGLEALLRATFPGGSITGAPKIRAMQIIEELEPTRRGIYTGATGWLGAAGDLDLAVAIRTAVWVHHRRRLYLGVGGGIVVDSDPAAELAETEAKAAAFARICGASDL